MNTLESAIRNLEGQLTVARDKAKFHRERAEFYDREAVKFDAAVNAIVAVMGTRDEDIVEAFDATDKVDAQREVVAEAAKPFQASAPARNGPKVFDRDIIKRELRNHHIRYPVAHSHRKVAHFVRQCLITACVMHPDYQNYLDKGGFNLWGLDTKNNDCIRDAIETLGVNRQKVVDDARVLHRLIYSVGVEGVDYK
jgi:hypothetical protein